jgi:hypothetical protein
VCGSVKRFTGIIRHIGLNLERERELSAQVYKNKNNWDRKRASRGKTYRIDKLGVLDCRPETSVDLL